jgi:DNA-binding LytR/AlgR family response regulator
MILRLEQNISRKDIEVLVTYPVMNTIVDRIASFINSVDMQIECYSGKGIQLIDVPDIYYIESFDKATVIHCEKESLQTDFRLYQLKEKLSDKGFVQISKYCILNISKLHRIRPLFNSRMETVLKNGERLFVNRKYLANIRGKLKNNE